MANLISYGANFTKSIAHVTVESVKNMNPALMSFAEANDEISKEVYSAVKDWKGTVKKAKTSIVESETYRLIGVARNNIMEDLKSGKWYNPEREASMNNRMADSIGSEMMDDDWEFGGDTFDFNDDSDDENYDADFENMNTVGRAVSNAVSEATVKSADYIATTTAQSTKAILAQNKEMFARVNLNIAGVNSSILSLVEMKKPIMDHISITTEFYKHQSESMDKLVELVDKISKVQEANTITKKKELSTRKDYNYITSGGMLDFKRYGELIKDNLKKNGGSLASFNNMFGNESMIEAMLTSPLSFILEEAVNKVIPNIIKKNTEVFNNSIEGIFGSLMAKLDLSRKNSGNPALNWIANILGVPSDIGSNIDTSRYEKGKVDFDGITRKSITEVIPTYLAKILSAVSGSPETRYDFKTGKFVKLSTIALNNNRNQKYYRDNALSGLDKSIQDGLKHIAFDSKYAKDNFLNDLEIFYDKLYEDNGFFDYHKKDASYYGISDRSFQIIKSIFEFNNRMGKRSINMNLSNKVYSNKSRQFNENSELELYGDDIRFALLNGSLPKGLNGEKLIKGKNENVDDWRQIDNLNQLKNTVFTDDKGRDIFFYLQDYYQQIGAINNNIQEYFENGTVSNPKNKSKADKEIKKPNFINIRELPYVDYESNWDKEQKEAQEQFERANQRIKEQNSFNIDLSKYDWDQYGDAITNGLNDIYNIDKAKRDLSVNKNKKTYQGPIIDQLLKAETLGEKAQVLVGNIQQLAQKPTDYLAAILEKSDQRVYNMIFGYKDEDPDDDRGMLEKIQDGFKDSFQRFNNEIDKTFLEPLKEKLDGKKGGFKKFLNEKFGIDIDQATHDIKVAIFGETMEDGNRVGGLFGNFIQETKDTMYQWMKDGAKIVKKELEPVYDMVLGKDTSKKSVSTSVPIVKSEDIENDEESQYYDNLYAHMSGNDIEDMEYEKEQQRAAQKAKTIRDTERAKIELAMKHREESNKKARDLANEKDFEDSYSSMYDQYYDDIDNMATGGLVTKTGVIAVTGGEYIIPAPGDKKKQLAKENAAKRRFFKHYGRNNFKDYGNYAPGGQVNADGTGEVRQISKAEQNVMIAKENVAKMAKDVHDAIVGDNKERKEFSDKAGKYLSDAYENAPSLAAGAILGGGFSLVTGLVGGPLLGAAVGAGTALISKSKNVQDALFGTTDEETGEHKEGLLGDQVTDFIKEKLPGIAKGGLTGSVLGLTHLAPGGPVGGLILGSAIGYAKQNKAITDVLFGEDNYEKFEAKLKKAMPAMGAGALVSALASPLPGGIVSKLIVGGALGYISQTDKVKNFLFGPEDPQTGKRNGGVVGDLVGKLLKPIGEYYKDFALKMKDWFSEKVAKPIITGVTEITNSIKERVKNFFDERKNKTKKAIKKRFKKTKLYKAGQWVKDKALGATKNVAKFGINAVTFLPRAALRAPAKAIGGIGNHMRYKDIIKGGGYSYDANENAEFLFDRHYKKALKDAKKKGIEPDQQDKWIQNNITNYMNDKEKAQYQKFNNINGMDESTLQDILAISNASSVNVNKRQDEILDGMYNDITGTLNKYGVSNYRQNKIRSIIGSKDGVLNDMKGLVGKDKDSAILKQLDKIKDLDPKAKEEILKIYQDQSDQINQLYKGKDLLDGKFGSNDPSYRDKLNKTLASIYGIDLKEFDQKDETYQMSYREIFKKYGINPARLSKGIEKELDSRSKYGNTDEDIEEELEDSPKVISETVKESKKIFDSQLDTQKEILTAINELLSQKYGIKNNDAKDALDHFGDRTSSSDNGEGEVELDSQDPAVETVDGVDNKAFGGITKPGLVAVTKGERIYSPSLEVLNKIYNSIDRKFNQNWTTTSDGKIIKLTTGKDGDVTYDTRDKDTVETLTSLEEKSDREKSIANSLTGMGGLFDGVKKFFGFGKKSGDDSSDESDEDDDSSDGIGSIIKLLFGKKLNIKSLLKSGAKAALPAGLAIAATAGAFDNATSNISIGGSKPFNTFDYTDPNSGTEETYGKSLGSQLRENFVRGEITGKGSVLSKSVGKSMEESSKLISKSKNIVGKASKVFKKSSEQEAKNLAKEGVEKYSKKTLTQNVSNFIKKIATKISNSKLGKKILSKFPSAGEALMESADDIGEKAATTATAKGLAETLSNAVLVIKIVILISDFVNGCSRAEIFWGLINRNANTGETIISGLCNMIKNAIGVVGSLIPDTWIGKLFKGIIKKVDPDWYQENLGDDVEESQKILDEYNSENGTDLTTEEYIKTVQGKDKTMWETIKSNWKKLTTKAKTDTEKEEQAELANKVNKNLNGVDPDRDIDTTSDSKLQQILNNANAGLQAGSAKGSGIKTKYSAAGSFISQVNKSYANTAYGDSTIGEQGCGPATATMVINDLNNKKIDLGTAASYALSKGYKDESGTNASYFEDIFNKYGIQSNYIENKGASSLDKIKSELANNKDVVLLGKDAGNNDKNNSPFGPNDHYVVATGIDSNGNVIVNDPESNKPSKRYSQSILNKTKLAITTSSANSLSGSGTCISKYLRRRFIGAGSIPGNSNREKIWNYCRANGATEEVAAAIIGNGMQESGCKPDVKQYGGGKGRGLFQWSEGEERFARLQEIAAANGCDWTDLYSQLQLLWEEMFGNQAYYFKKNANMTPDEFIKMTDIAAAVKVFEESYERAGKPQLEKRIQYAKEAYSEFTGTPIESIDSSSNTITTSSTSTDSSSSESLTLLDKLKNGFNDAFNNTFTTKYGSNNLFSKLKNVFGLSSDDSTSTDSNTSSSTTTNSDLGQKIVEIAKSKIGKIPVYTQKQSERFDIDGGKGDCSSFAEYCLTKAGAVDPGSNTGSQINAGTTVDTANSDGMPNVSNLQPGDLLFYKSGTNNGRTENVGHVEIYAGNNTTIGNGSAPGAKEHDLTSYSQDRKSNGKGYIRAQRYSAAGSNLKSKPFTGGASNITSNNGSTSTTVVRPNMTTIKSSNNISTNSNTTTATQNSLVSSNIVNVLQKMVAYLSTISENTGNNAKIVEILSSIIENKTNNTSSGSNNSTGSSSNSFNTVSDLSDEDKALFKELAKELSIIAS